MNILIIGLGSIGKKHVDVIIELFPESNIYALRSTQTNDTYKKSINIKSIDELSTKIDFVIISNVTYKHVDAIEIAIQLNCPLFIEKPVLENFTHANNLLYKINLNKIQTYVACNMRFHPCLEFISNYLRTKNDKINEVNIYCGSYLPDWRPQKDYLKSYSANEFMGGGVDLDLIHEMDYMVWLFGFPQKVLSLKKSNSTLKINSYDSVRYLVDYPSFSIGITLNYFRRDSRRCLEIVMQDDTIIVDLNLCEIKSMISGNIFFSSSFSIMDTYKKQMLYFVDSLASKKNHINDFENAINILKLAI